MRPTTESSSLSFKAGLAVEAAPRLTPGLDPTVLQSLQWSDLPAFERLIRRSGEDEGGWAIHTLSRSLVNWPTSEDRALIGLTGDFGHGDETVVVGVAGLVPDPRNGRDAHLSILVDPDHRGRGVGGQLLAAILDIAVARGYQSASARARSDNAAGIRLMRRQGFTVSSHPGAEPIRLHRLLGTGAD